MLETRILINKNETREVGSQDYRQFPGGGVDALECSWPRLEPVLQEWGISIPYFFFFLLSPIGYIARKKMIIPDSRIFSMNRNDSTNLQRM